MALVQSDIQNIIVAIEAGRVGLFMLQWTAPKTSVQYVYVRYREVGDISWTVAYTALPILPSGVPSDSPAIIIETPSFGVKYEIEVKNNDNLLSSTTTIYIPLQFYSNNYLVGDSPYDLCGSQPIQLFSKLPFGTGVELFYDIEMTDLIDESMVSQNVYGDIYSVAAGVVGMVSAYGCYNGYGEVFLLSNSMDACEDGAYILYIDEFNPQTIEGLILYLDKELTTNVTGFQYVVRTSSGEIFELDSVTGEVGELIGECIDAYNVLVNNQNSRRQITGVFNILGFAINATLFVGDSSAGFHAAFEGGISISITGAGNCDSCGVDSASLYKNDVLQERIDVQDGTYLFASATYLNTDVIMIVLEENHCDAVPFLMS